MATSGDRFLLQSVIPGVKPLEVEFRFVQPGVEGFIEAFPMFDIKQEFDKYPIDTTLSRDTFEGLGYTFPKDAP